MVLNDDEVSNIISEKMEIVLQIGKDLDTPEINEKTIKEQACSDDCIYEKTAVNNDGDIQNLLKDKIELILQVGAANEDQKINGAVQSGEKQISLDDSESRSAAFTVEKCFDEATTASRDRKNDFNTTDDSATIVKPDSSTSEQSNTVIDSAEDTEERLQCDRKWIVLLAAFLSLGLSTGFPFNMSVLYVEWLQEFGKSNSETSLIQSVCTGLFLIGGFVSGIIVTKFGPMKCGILGGFLAFIGLGVSFVATSILHLVLTIGIVSGMGFSLAYISASTSVGMYFKGKQRLLALAFISFGSGCGASVFPVILEELVLEYGWRGALLIIAGLMLHLVLTATLYKAPKKSTKHRRVSFVENESEKMEHTTEVIQTTTGSNIPYQEPKNGVVNNDNNKLKRVSFSTTELRRLYDTEDNKNKSIVNILKGIFKNKIFMCYCFAQALCVASFNSVLIFFVDYYQFKGLSRSDAVSLYLYMNIVSTLFRFLPGFLKQLPHISVLSIPAVSALVGSAAMVGFTQSGSSFSLNLIAACGYGLGIGGMVTVLSISIIKLVGQEDYSAGLGTSMTVSGIFNAAAGPISGLIRDTTGNYDISYYSAGAALFVSSIFFFLTMACRHYDNRKKGSRFDFEMIIRRKSRRSSSILPWRRKSVDFHL